LLFRRQFKPSRVQHGMVVDFGGIAAGFIQ
jgi:hypothetical protein